MSFGFAAIGDSKTAGMLCCGYQDNLKASLEASGNWPVVRQLNELATGGKTTALAAAGIDAYLAAFTDPAAAPDWVLINLGSNDFAAIDAATLTQAAWEADMGYVLDAIHAKWPQAMVGLMRPIYIGFETAVDLYDDTWIPAVLSTRSSFAVAGPDERVFLPGHMDGATHPDESGFILTAAAWQTAMGY